jgi:hypothetical protein
VPALFSDVDTGIPRAKFATNTVAVVVGVERYERAAPVPFARHDAAVFREYASALFGAGDDPLRSALRTDDEVTGNELHRLFDAGGWLSRQVDGATDVVVYFAGRSVTDPRSGAPYLLPNDGDPNYPAQSAYALRDLYARLAALPARSVTVFLDAALTAGTIDDGVAHGGARGIVVSLEHPALRSPTMAVFAASTATQSANALPSQQHGLFTYWLLAGLRGGADTNVDGAISIAELEQFLMRRVPPDAARLDREQTPSVVARDRQRTLVQFR